MVYVQSSFGFGLVGGILLVVHPCYLFVSIEPAIYQGYKSDTSTVPTVENLAPQPSAAEVPAVNVAASCLSI